MTAIRQVLLVEDSHDYARLIRAMFDDHGAHDALLVHVGSMREAEEYLADQIVDIVLLDLGLPDAEGIEAVRRTHAAAPRLPIAVLTGLDDEGLVAQALQEGAQGYLVKGQLDPRGLLRALRYAVERKTMEEALFAATERAAVTLNCIGDAVLCTDLDGCIDFLNLAAEQLTGWPRHEALGRPWRDVLNVVDAETRKAIPNPMKLAMRRNRTIHVPSNCVLIRRDGAETAIEDSVAPIRDREGHPAGAVIVFRDVSPAQAMVRQMAHLAHHDLLTGLPNRLLLTDRVGQAIALARRHATIVALLFLDLDGFKHINDSLGHPVGDRLLQSVAQRLVTCVRGSDTVSRQGGDEFVVLLPELTGVEEAAVVAAKVLHMVAQPHTIAPHELQITTSIGVSVYPTDGLNVETLIKNADTAMYQAKAQGHQSYRFFESSMNVRAVERQSIEADLRRAVDHRAFTLNYQPKVNLHTGRIAGAEALIRWTHPLRGPLPPADFIPIAEECGLIVRMGQWVLREACIQARSWLEAGLALGSIAVNISAVEFRAAPFLDGVFAILEETGLSPRYLELELTESVLMQNAARTAAILQALRARGVRLAIDDFGIGYSSLSYLGRLPVDTLKIDQSFVHQLLTAPEEATIVTAVIHLGHSLGLRVVAEGVETEDELTFLQAQRCDEGQGYHFSRPLDPDQFQAWLESRESCA